MPTSRAFLQAVIHAFRKAHHSFTVTVEHPLDLRAELRLQRVRPRALFPENDFERGEGTEWEFSALVVLGGSGLEPDHASLEVGLVDNVVVVEDCPYRQHDLSAGNAILG